MEWFLILKKRMIPNIGMAMLKSKLLIILDLLKYKLEKISGRHSLVGFIHLMSSKSEVLNSSILYIYYIYRGAIKYKKVELADYSNIIKFPSFSKTEKDIREKIRKSDAQEVKMINFLFRPKEKTTICNIYIYSNKDHE